MPDQRFSLLARELRDRVDEILARIDSFHDEDFRRELRTIAATYEKMANRLERRAREEG